MDSGATKHMASHRVAFNTYKANSPHNVCLGDDSVAQAIRMGPLLLELKQKAKQIELATRMYFTC